VKHRADLVVFWGCDPAATHPRLIERYVPPRPGRTVVVVDDGMNATPTDLRVTVTPGRHWDLLRELHLKVTKSVRTPPVVHRPTGGDGNGRLADLMKSARFGVVFFGDRPTTGPNSRRTVEALYQLVTELNRSGRFYALRLDANVSGATSVLTWQFGYPFGVYLAAGYPRYNPGEFTGSAMLSRHEVDACVLVGSAAVQHLSAPAVEHLKAIPVVVLDPSDADPFPSTVRFVTASFGVQTAGTAYRLDGVSLPLRPLLPSPFPDDAEVLRTLLKRCS
jgi:formylmethanofuran dehydrogenase subunit B